jgi:hypothetical protein
MLDGIPLLNLTPSVLLGIVVLFIFLGRLVTRQTLLDERERTQEWKKAFEVEREARILADAQTAELLELAKTSHDILNAMFLTTTESPTAYQGRRRASGGAYVAPTQR